MPRTQWTSTAASSRESTRKYRYGQETQLGFKGIQENVDAESNMHMPEQACASGVTIPVGYQLDSTVPICLAICLAGTRKPGIILVLVPLTSIGAGPRFRGGTQSCAVEAWQCRTVLRR